jgi:hypothetical protein
MSENTAKLELLGLRKRFAEWWHPTFTIDGRGVLCRPVAGADATDETRDVDELGYGTVILRPAKMTLPMRLRYNQITRRFRNDKPITMHVGTEDMEGFFHEFDSWTVPQR